MFISVLRLWCCSNSEKAFVAGELCSTLLLHKERAVGHCSSVRDDEDMKRDGVTRKRGRNDETPVFVVVWSMPWREKKRSLLKIDPRLEEEERIFFDGGRNKPHLPFWSPHCFNLTSKKFSTSSSSFTSSQFLSFPSHRLIRRCTA